MITQSKKLFTALLVMFLLPLCILAQSTHSQSNDNRDVDRWMWQMPSRVINEIGITEGMVVADLGAGEGYFSIRLAKTVGPNGIVYASDINENVLKILEQISKQNNLNNIVIIHGEPTDPLLPNKSTDLVLIVNTIHMIDDFNTFMLNTFKGLKPNGNVVIVQWDAEKMQKELTSSSSISYSLSMSTTLRKILNSGLDVQKILTFLPMQNIYVCSPQKK